MTDQESWNTWREHVLSEIKRSNDCFIILNDSTMRLSIEIAKLQVKSGIWGVIGGMVSVLIVIAVDRIK